MTIAIKNKIWQIGSSHVITIPHVYIVKGILSPGQTYEITINENINKHEKTE